MNNAFIAGIVALGSAAWIGNKFSKRSGSDMQKVFVAAAVSGVIVFIVVLSLFSFMGDK